MDPVSFFVLQVVLIGFATLVVGGSLISLYFNKLDDILRSLPKRIEEMRESWGEEEDDEESFPGQHD